VEDSAAAIQTENLTKTYGRQTAVDALSLRIEPGEVFGFLGPNGAGKTTTLLMLLGLTEPTAGTARVLGLDPAREPLRVKKDVGYLQENVGFYRDLSARQTLRLMAELNGIPRGEATRRMDAALAGVGLESAGEKKVGVFSRGMRQRLGLAEVLVKQPRVAFLDEPTLGLDPEATDTMLETISRLARESGMTIMLCSHQLQQVQRICSRVGIMIGGRLAALGTIGQLALETHGTDSEGRSLEEIYHRYFPEAGS
jgi:ABC-2 type transport system ATP-binding protein